MAEAFQDPAPSVRRGLGLEQGCRTLLPGPPLSLCHVFWELDFTCSTKRASPGSRGAILPSDGCWCGEQSGARQEPALPTAQAPTGLGFGMLRSSWEVGRCRRAPPAPAERHHAALGRRQKRDVASGDGICHFSCPFPSITGGSFFFFPFNFFFHFAQYGAHRKRPLIRQRN